MKKDIVIKRVIRNIAEDIAINLIGLEIDSLELIDKEFDRVEKREADIVARVKLSSQKEIILHIEIQNSNDKEMIFRMLRYLVDIKFEYKELEVYQYLVYIGKSKLNMKNNFSQKNIDYKYNLIDMQKIDCEQFMMADDPNAIVLAILCDFKDKDPSIIIKNILLKLKELTKDDEFNFRKYYKMLEILSTNRNLEKTLKEEKDMLRVDIEKLPSYEIGYEDGEIKGIKKGIKEGIERGVEEGLERGLERGKKRTKIVIAKKLLLSNINIELISQSTDLTKEEIIDLKNRS